MAERTVSVRLAARVEAYLAGMKAAEAATLKMAGVTQAQMTRVGTSMQGVGRKMTTFVTLPIVAAGALAVKSAVDWESAWAGVTKTVDGTAEQMADLERGLRDMAKELPATHQEIAAVAEAAGQLGVGVEDVEDFTRVMIDLGETTNLSADEAATALARFMNIMGTSQDDVSRLGSSIVELGNNSATTEAEIVEMATRLAAAGRQAGLSEADVLAFSAALTSVGVNAEAGGTAFSKVFRTINDAVIDGGDKLETLARVAGVSAEQFATAFREDPAQAIAAFISGLGDVAESGESTTGILGDLGLSNERVSRALLSAGQAGDVLTDSLGSSRDAWQENTALTEEAAKRYETAAAKFEVVRNKIVDLFIDLGNIVLPMVEKVVDVIGFLAEKFQALPQPVQIAVGGFLGLVAAMGPMVFIAGSLIKNLGQITAIMSKVGPAAGRAGLAFGALGLAAAAGFTAYQLFTAEQRETDRVTRDATAALDIEIESLFAAAEAAAEAGREIDGVAIANEALSLSIAEASDDLTKALADLNVSAAEALGILVLYEQDPVTALRRLGESFGLTTEQAALLSSTMADTSDGQAAMMSNTMALADELGLTESQMEALAVSMLGFIRAQDNVDTEQIARDFLDARVSALGYEDSLIAAAEANLGFTRQTGSAIAVYEKWSQLVAAADEETRNAAQGVDELADSTSELGSDWVWTGGNLADWFTKLERASGGVKELDNRFTDLNRSSGPTTDAIRGIGDAIAEMLGLTEQPTFTPFEAILGARDKLQGVADAVADASAAFDGLAESGVSAADAWAELERVFDAGFIRQLGQDLSGIRGPSEGWETVLGLDQLRTWGEALHMVIDPQIAFVESQDAIWESALAAGDAINEETKSLEDNTPAAMQNRRVIIDWVKDILAGADAQLAMGDSVADVTGTLNHNIGALRQHLIALGADKDEVDRLLVSLGIYDDDWVAVTKLQTDLLGQKRLEQMLLDLDEFDEEFVAEIVAIAETDGAFAAIDALENHTENLNPVVNVHANLGPFMDALRRAQSIARFGVALRGVFGSAEGRFVRGGSNILTTAGERSGRSGDELILPLGDPGRMAALLGLPEVGPRVAEAMGRLMPASSMPSMGSAPQARADLPPIYVYNNGRDITSHDIANAIVEARVTAGMAA